MEIKLRSFESQILYFNGLYKLPISATPGVLVQAQHECARLSKEPNSAMPLGDAILSRLRMFADILKEECKEIEELYPMAEQLSSNDDPVVNRERELNFLVALADLLGDINVYCTSEAARYGIPLAEVQSIIMQSNFSKLDKDGNPIYDERGKVQKGPFYWKPEPKIKQLLEEKMNGS